MSKASDILDNVSKVIVGKRNVSELVLTRSEEHTSELQSR